MKSEIYNTINAKRGNASLIIVSKYRSEEALMEYYEIGHRDFAENRVQELMGKYEHLPKDIKWHMIGHLQSNKVKYIAPFIHMIHSIHALSLLDEVDKQAKKHNRIIPVCIQFNLAKEDTKSGFAYEEWQEVMEYASLKTNIKVVGIMCMGPNVEDETKIKEVFVMANTLLKEIQNVYPEIVELSMGMSHDYELAVECGSSLIRVGSILFE
jgi:pyridoxal phosphate enzyme (YggS family)